MISPVMRAISVQDKWSWQIKTLMQWRKTVKRKGVSVDTFFIIQQQHF